MKLVLFQDPLEKGRKPLPEGTLRVYSGMKFRKQGGKWVYAGDGKQQPAPEAETPKQEQRDVIETDVADVGTVDRGLADILDTINNQLGYVTLASCSGLQEDHPNWEKHYPAYPERFSEQGYIGFVKDKVDVDMESVRKAAAVAELYFGEGELYFTPGFMVRTAFTQDGTPIFPNDVPGSVVYEAGRLAAEDMGLLKDVPYEDHDRFLRQVSGKTVGGVDRFIEWIEKRAEWEDRIIRAHGGPISNEEVERRWGMFIAALKGEVARKKIAEKAAHVPQFTSVQEATDWAKTNLDIDYVEWGDKFPLEHVQAVTEQMALVSKKFPNVRIQGVGEMTPTANAVWKINFEGNVKRDRLEYKGPRWRQSEAETRVRKKMFDEPTDRTYNTESAAGRMLLWAWRADQVNKKAPGSDFVDGRFGRGGGWIGITPFWTTIEKPGLENQLRQQRKTEQEFGKRFTAGGGGIESVFLHEFGHVFDRFQGMQNLSPAVELKGRGHYEFSLSDHFLQWWNALGGKNSLEITKGLSQYASTNTQEFFAELMCDCFVPEEHQQPLTKMFIEKFGKELGLV